MKIFSCLCKWCVTPWTLIVWLTILSSAHQNPVYFSAIEWVVFGFEPFRARCTYALTLILLTWSIGWALNNVSKWQTGFNSAFKGLKQTLCASFASNIYKITHRIFLPGCNLDVVELAKGFVFIVHFVGRMDERKVHFGVKERCVGGTCA